MSWTGTLRRLLQLAVVAGAALALAGQAAAKANPYTNALAPQIPGDGVVESCADPTLIRGQQPGDRYWYAYCTTDPLNDTDRNASGGFNFHLIPILRSLDLTNWTYVGDAFASKPGWVHPNAGMWAPEIVFINGQYHLYYGASDTVAGGSAIGVGISPSPTGPFVDAGRPVVEPHAADCCPGSRRWVYDPEVVTVGAQRYIFYGSYFGGIAARMLTADGLSSVPATQTPITIANRYEGPEVIQNDGWFYLFVSATDCCRGPLTGYSVFVGRSRNVLGPYVDREGAPLLAGRVGGTPVISMNGNRFVGMGHNTVFQDFAGQWWTLYHAVDVGDPYFAGAVGFTKRPLLLDPIDWVGGWPTVRGGYWASDDAQHGPAAQPGDATRYRTREFRDVRLGKIVLEASDEFNGSIGPQWSWVRPPAEGTYGVTPTTFRFNTQDADLHVDNNSASVLAMPAPKSDYVVETRVHLNLPAEGCCFNYRQAGLAAYENDDNYVKLVHVSIWETRQTEFAKEVAPVPAGYPRYGNTVVGPPSDWTYLRVARCGDRYTPYTSRDGTTWVRGGSWVNDLDANERIGLVSMGGSGFVANFDYVRTYRAHGCTPSVR